MTYRDRAEGIVNAIAASGIYPTMDSLILLIMECVTCLDLFGNTAPEQALFDVISCDGQAFDFVKSIIPIEKMRRIDEEIAKEIRFCYRTMHRVMLHDGLETPCDCKVRRVPSRSYYW